MRFKGKISSWHDDKGFGFIEPLQGGARLFVHIKAFSNRNRRPAINDCVTYAVGRDKEGRVRAVDAFLEGDKRPQGPKRKGSAAAVLFALSFLVIVGVSAFMADLALPIVFACPITSAITFLMYGFDKSAAMNGRWRISEGTLHLLSLAGGWPGALIARHVLRHKSRKQPFRFVFWITVLLNCAGLAWLYTTGNSAGSLLSKGVRFI